MKNENGKKINSCTIITSKPNNFMSKIHNRMPVILDEKDINFWINPENKDWNKLLKLLKAQLEELP